MNKILTDKLMGRKSSGKVKIDVDKGRLRLVFSWEGRRQFLYLGLEDKRENRLVAEMKAKTIEADMALNNFDSTLQKYKGKEVLGRSLLVVDLFRRFTEWKTKKVSPRTLEKYFLVQNNLEERMGSRVVLELDNSRCEAFADWLLGRVTDSTAAERIQLLKACWNWGNSRGLVKGNPWAGISVKISPKQRPKPFTREESRKIIEAFQAHPRFKCYADFVEFRLATGCRTGEAIALQWKAVNDDCSQVWIGETFKRGVRKETKTGKTRLVNVSKRIQKMLLKRRGEGKDPEAIVFPAPQGGYINDSRFSRKIWKKILEQVDVPFRKPYNLRHTQISQALQAGTHITDVADQVGNTPAIILKNYAGSIHDRPRLPDMFEGEQD